MLKIVNNINYIIIFIIYKKNNFGFDISTREKFVNCIKHRQIIIMLKTEY